MPNQAPSAKMLLLATAALADPTRRELMELLRNGPRNVGELATDLPVSRPAVSQHLKLLREAKLVQEHRQGTRHYFSINPAGIEQLRAHFHSMWQDSLDAFARFVSEQETAARQLPAKRKGK